VFCAVGFFLGMSIDIVLFIRLKMQMNGNRKKYTIKSLTRTRPSFQFVTNIVNYEIEVQQQKGLDLHDVESCNSPLPWFGKI
jgi:hypothetical protein